MKLPELTNFIFFIIIDWVLIRFHTEFNPEKQNKKYIILPRSIAKYFIQQKSSRVKYVKVKDRQKLSIPCFIGYIACIITVITAILMYILPDYPCKPLMVPYSRRHTLTVYTYNSKVPYILSFLIFTILIDIILINSTIKLFKVKDKPVSFWIKIGCIALTSGFVAVTLNFIFELF